jgi:hypothetical protein
MTTKIKVSVEAIFKGWGYPRSKLWHIPQVNIVRNENTDTLLLNHFHKHDCLNFAYNVESTIITREHINSIMLQAINWEYIHKVYEFPSIKLTIRYLHAAAGFPTEASWLKSICWVNYNS